MNQQAPDDGTLTAVAGRTPVVAWRLVRADGTVLSEYLPEKVFTPASTLKLAVLVAVARGVQAGRFSLEDQVLAADTWPSDHDGTPFGFHGEEKDPDWPAGQQLSITDICHRMITVSSNEATNVLIDLAGRENIAAVFDDAGCTHSGLRRRYGDMLAYRHQGAVSGCTAGDLAELMAALIRGDLLNAELTGYCCDLLAQQRDGVIGGVVPEVFGSDTRWGSKSGWVEGIRHDVAFIEAPEPLVLGVCTQGFTDHPDAVAAIRALARGVLLPHAG
ncbi:serine hydrolase [Nesterenkonia sp. MY13]|uniref:Serine hydrolase n=1 Tax=Nesterenkonia sedimenti TaxID=1463632 RepID=A0A7X8TL51_9MICC|nr:serine hydrolase [Nesterenkonia sedimenti]NLS10791.1 serine hydrolase [Nesterenkonia sedimenti]